MRPSSSLVIKACENGVIAAYYEDNRGQHDGAPTRAYVAQDLETLTDFVGPMVFPEDVLGGDDDPLTLRTHGGHEAGLLRGLKRDGCEEKTGGSFGFDLPFGLTPSDVMDAIGGLGGILIDAMPDDLVKKVHESYAETIEALAKKFGDRMRRDGETEVKERAARNSFRRRAAAAQAEGPVPFSVPTPVFTSPFGGEGDEGATSTSPSA
jgi:hypothetical protein